MAAAPKNKIRLYAFTGSVFAITVVGSIVGAQLKEDQEKRKVRHTSIPLSYDLCCMKIIVANVSSAKATHRRDDTRGTHRTAQARPARIREKEV